MTLSVLGLGFGRTGTESLKKALEILGCGPCYHMFEVLPHQNRVDEWVSLVQGKTPDWDKTFAGYHASVDWPGAFFWRELAEHYGDAKFILTTREPERWYDSMAKTILPLLRETAVDPNSLANQMFISRTFGGDIDDRDNVIETFLRHNAAVKAAIPSDQLLELEVGAGWDPLCAFLGIDVPDVPYPWGNRADEFVDNIDRAQAQREAVLA
ncbi:MAG: sulfotransferase family protein [Boseongicola sp.]|nr:MAG: sulfotransferase family protein [Boseongicola sp.]